jgi:CubicO group peptidase (beta-lactamase class C family)
MQLVDRGEIALDTRVMPFLGIAGTRIVDEVTVFHLLTHTSGIGDDADEEAGEDYADLWVEKPNFSVRQTRDFLPQFVDRAPNFAPGEGVRYNNVAFVLLGLVIEQVSGMPYRDYVRRHVFAPAGMVGADFCAMDDACANFAEHYRKVVRDDGGVEWRKNIYSYPPVGSPDGGATVTARDLDRFVRAIRSRTLMGADAAGALLRPQVRKRELDGGSLWNGFAFEFTVGGDGEVVRFGKDGVNAGVASFATWFPERDVTCVLLANQDCDVWAMQRDLNPLFSDWHREG